MPDDILILQRRSIENSEVVPDGLPRDTTFHPSGRALAIRLIRLTPVKRRAKLLWGDRPERLYALSRLAGSGHIHEWH